MISCSNIWIAKKKKKFASYGEVTVLMAVSNVWMDVGNWKNPFSLLAKLMCQRATIPKFTGPINWSLSCSTPAHNIWLLNLQGHKKYRYFSGTLKLLYHNWQVSLYHVYHKPNFAVDFLINYTLPITLRILSIPLDGIKVWFRGDCIRIAFSCLDNDPFLI